MLRTATNTNQVMSKAVDIKSLTAYSHYLVMRAQLSGNLCFDGHKPSEDERKIAEQCRLLSSKISRILDVCRLNEVPDLIEYYDILYRIGNKCMPDSSFISGHKLRVFKAWRAGDRRIEESQVFGIIAPQVTYHPETADRTYFAIYQSLKERWIATLGKHDRFPDATTYENYQRLALMMRENLDRELGKDADAVKRRWYKRNRVDDLTTLGTQLLRSYRRFVSSLFPSILNHKTVLDIDNRILEELSTRPYLPPHDREAFLLAREYNRQMM